MKIIEIEISKIIPYARNQKEHTAKQIKQVAASIKRFGFIQPIVLDPFLGSGTTLISAEKSNRVCYGLELDPKFVDVIVQRWVDYTGVTEIKCNGKEIVWPVSEAAYDETDQENDQGE